MRVIISLLLVSLALSVYAADAGPALDLSDQALDQRIDALRKGTFTITIPPKGRRQITVPVSYRLRRHAFLFGTALNAKYLLADPATDADARHYQETVQTYFNAAVAENVHKWHAMENQQGVLRDDQALALWQWCHDHQLTMRGHCVYWGVDQFVPAWVKTLPPTELQAALDQRLRHVLDLFRGKIPEWDLNNEMMHQDYFARTLGYKNGANYFLQAQALAPEIRWCVNEYNIMSGNQVDQYVAQIRTLLDAGAKVGGIGDQAHFSGRVPPNDKLWAVLDKLGQFGIPVKITEFDIDTHDEVQQAADTRRFYKLCFAHPAVNGILMWGFWEGAHWRPNAALWRKDWSIKPNGQAYIDLMKEWQSDGTVRPDAHGRITFRGFYGDYEITAGNQTWQVSLTKDGQADVLPVK